MARKMTSKCDGCGVEHVDDGEMPGIPSILGAGRRRGTDNWGNLSVATGSFPAMFDLCDGCTKRVVAFLELEVPDPRAVMQKHFGGHGGHAMYVPPGDFMPGEYITPDHLGLGKPWMRSVPMTGGLTPEDLRALGLTPDSPIEMDMSNPPPIAPGVDMSTNTFTCPKCSSSRDCQSFNPVCIACGYQDPDPKYRR